MVAKAALTVAPRVGASGGLPPGWEAQITPDGKTYYVSRRVAVSGFFLCCFFGVEFVRVVCTSIHGWISRCIILRWITAPARPTGTCPLAGGAKIPPPLRLPFCPLRLGHRCMIKTRDDLIGTTNQRRRALGPTPLRSHR